MEYRAGRRWLVRLAGLILLLGAEFVALTLPFDSQAALLQQSFYLEILLALLNGARPAFISAVAAAAFLSWDVLRDELDRVLREQERSGATAVPWLIAHLVPATTLAFVTSIRGSGRVTSIAGAEIWASLCVVLGLAAIVTWAFALLPPRFWLRWITRSRAAFAAGAVIGWAAYVLGGFAQFLWLPVQRWTFAVVVLLLSLIGQPIIVNADRFLIGTPSFVVRVGGQCSGLEGLGLICAFLAMYLWFYRREMRFPQAFLLVPMGAFAMWLMNSVRIAGLILIGSWDPGVGFKGFHSVAGWLFFNFVACGLIWASRRLGLFNNAPSAAPGPSPAAVYLVPMLVIIATSMITVAFSSGFEILYPLRVITAALALWFYRAELAAMQWKLSGFAIAAGVLVFALWIVLVPDSPAFDLGFDQALHGLPIAGAAVWLLFRIAGSVATVPIAEEFAFRGYLTRKLISAEFETVPLGRFTWLSFLGSSILFGALHREWLVGTAAGMVFAAVLYRRGVLSDAVLAHATANGLLSAYALSLHRWSLWS